MIYKSLTPIDGTARVWEQSYVDVSGKVNAHRRPDYNRQLTLHRVLHGCKDSVTVPVRTAIAEEMP